MPRARNKYPEEYLYKITTILFRVRRDGVIEDKTVDIRSRNRTGESFADGVRKVFADMIGQGYEVLSHDVKSTKKG